MTAMNDAERAGFEDWFEREAVARAICEACEESPDHQGDAQGNEYRWQDYLPVADAAISAWQRTQAAWVPEAKVTGAWESARIGDFNAGWNACRDSVVTLMKKAAYMELDTTKRSIAIQDELRDQLAAAPARQAVQDMVRAALSPENQRVVPVKPLLADPHPMAASPAQPDVQRLQIALRLSANRFDRLALEFPNASDMRWTASEWANEARSAIAASTGQEVS